MSNSRSSDSFIQGALMGSVLSYRPSKFNGIAYAKGLQTGQQLENNAVLEKLRKAPTFIAAYDAHMKELSAAKEPEISKAEKNLAEQFKKCDTQWFTRHCKKQSVAAARADLSKRLQNSSFVPASSTVENKDEATLINWGRDHAAVNFNSYQIPKLVDKLSLETKDERSLSPR